MTYDVDAISKYISDENNNFSKEKVSHLKDIISKTKLLNKANHKVNLNYMMEKLKDSLLYDLYSSVSDFKELHSIIKGNVIQNGKRNLQVEEFKIILY